MKKVRFGDRKLLVVLFLTSLLAALVSGGVNVFLAQIVDLGYAGDLAGLLALVPIFVVIVVAELMNNIVKLIVKTQYVKRSMLLLKRRYLDKLVAKDITQVQKEYTTTYRSQLTQDMDRYENKFFEQLSHVFFLICNTLVSLAILFWVHAYIGGVATVLILVFLYISSKSGKPLQESESKKTASLNQYTTFIEESLDGFEVIKQHQLEQVREKAFQECAQKVQTDNYHLDVKQTYVDALNTLIQMVVIFVAIIGGLWFANTSDAGIGDVIKVVTAFSNLVWPMQQIIPSMTQMVGVQDVIKTFDERLEDPIVDRPIAISQYEDFSFKEASLGYDAPILSDVNIEIGQHDKILIVGPSGAGKSTVLKTMRQSIQPLSGAVLMNNYAIDQIEAHAYYKNFATVDQVGYIFNGTLKENVTLHQNVSEAVVKRALRAVRLDTLDLDMVLINNGANISGGQRARLLSARALALGASIIICDEIFAALDGDIAKDIEHDLLQLNQAIVNVSHIYFEDNLDAYDAIYRVNMGKVERIFDTRVLVDSMLKAS